MRIGCFLSLPACRVLKAGRFMKHAMCTAALVTLTGCDINVVCVLWLCEYE